MGRWIQAGLERWWIDRDPPADGYRPVEERFRHTADAVGLLRRLGMGPNHGAMGPAQLRDLAARGRVRWPMPVGDEQAITAVGVLIARGDLRVWRDRRPMAGSVELEALDKPWTPPPLPPSAPIPRMPDAPASIPSPLAALSPCAQALQDDLNLVKGAVDRAKELVSQTVKGLPNRCQLLASTIGAAADEFKKYSDALPAAKSLQDLIGLAGLPGLGDLPGKDAITDALGKLPGAGDLAGLADKALPAVQQLCLTRLPLDPAALGKALDLPDLSQLESLADGFMAALYKAETDGRNILALASKTATDALKKGADELSALKDQAEAEAAKLEQKAKDALKQAEALKDEAIAKGKEAAAELENQAKEALAKAEALKDQAEAAAKDALAQVEQQAKDAAAELEQQAKDAAAELEQQAKDAMDQAQALKDEAIAKAKEAAAELEAQAKKAQAEADALKKQAQDAVDKAKQEAKDAEKLAKAMAGKIQGIAAQAKDAALAKAAGAGAPGVPIYLFNDIKDGAQSLADKAGAAKDEAEAKAKDLLDQAEAARDKAEAEARALQEKAEALKDEAEAKAKELQAKAEALKDEAEAKLKEMQAKAEALKDQAEEKAKEILDKAEALKDAAEAQAKALADQAEALKDEAEQKAKELLDQAEALKDKAEADAKALEEKAKAALEEAEKAADEIISRIKSFDPGPMLNDIVGPFQDKVNAGRKMMSDFLKTCG